MIAIKRWFGALIVAVALVQAAPASAHPHVWVTSMSELVYAPDGTLTGVKHTWTFDEMFSSYALQGIDTAVKGTYTRQELAALAQTNVESLKEYDFFTFASVAGTSQAFNEPVDYWLEHKDAALVLHFTLPLKVPLKAKKLALEVYDTSFFVDFTLDKNKPFALVNAPAQCEMKVTGPKASKPASDKITEDMFDNDSAENKGDQFSSRLEVTCP